VPIIRSNGVQAKGCLWVVAILLILGLIGLGIGFLTGDRTLISGMSGLVGRMVFILVGAAIAYVLITVFLRGIFK
jgi:hypothetical protein